MTTRTRPIGTKLVVIRGDLHARIKRICFDNNVQMKDLINMMLTNVLDDTKRIQEIMAELQTDMV